MSIFLIRHGETASNATRILQTPDIPLNERGQAQAAQLARRLRELGIRRLLSSDHTRAAMTAEAIARACNVPIDWEQGLQERNFGDLRGQAYSDIPGDFFAQDYHPPGGESWPQFNLRVDRTWDRITRAWSSADGNLALVTHGLFCRSLVERRLELPQQAAPPRAFSNTSLTVIRSDPPWTVELLNCCEHLRENDAGARAGGIA